VKVKVVPVLN